MSFKQRIIQIGASLGLLWLICVAVMPQSRLQVLWLGLSVLSGCVLAWTVSQQRLQAYHWWFAILLANWTCSWLPVSWLWVGLVLCFAGLHLEPPLVVSKF